MRKKLMAANWKMYKTPDQTRDFFRDFLPLVGKHDRDEIAVCPPFVDVPAAVEAAKGSNVAIGAQNMKAICLPSGEDRGRCACSGG